ncbi:hypothetical protein D3C80_1736620 [compost metagenome]
MVQLLVDFKVLAHDNALNMRDCAAECRIFERFILSGRADRPIVAKAQHKLILQAYKKHRGSRVALASGTPAQLIVDPHAFIHMGTDHI